jgi:large subunit ribosomal protein L13e
VTVQAIVERKQKTRKGKGFSQKELKEAGLSLKQSQNLGIPIDTRRRSRHEENVKALMEFLQRDSKKAQ